MSTNNLGPRGEKPHETFPRDVLRGIHENLGTTFWGPAPLKLGRAKNIQNSTRFRTTSDSDRECLRNTLGYRQAENGVINYNPPTFDEKDLVNFGPLVTKFSRLISTRSKSTVRVISENFGLRSRICLERIEISTTGKRYQLRSFSRSTKKIP